LHRGRDDARVERRERLVAEAEALHRARAQVLDDDVGRLGQRLEHLTAALRLEVEGHALLVHVQHAEERRVHAGLLAEPVSCLLARRGLDLDDLGPQPRQRFRAARACLELRTVQDPDSFERRSHHWPPVRSVCCATTSRCKSTSLWPRRTKILSPRAAPSCEQSYFMSRPVCPTPKTCSASLKQRKPLGGV